MSEPRPSHKPRSPFKSPLAALAASFALGIVAAHSFKATPVIAWAPAAAAMCLLLGLIILRAGWSRVAVGFVFAAMVFAGLADAWRWQHRFPLNHVAHLESMGVGGDRPVQLEGRVLSTPYRAGHALQFDVEAQRIESGGGIRAVAGKIRLRVQRAEAADPNGGVREIQYGDIIRATVRLSRPHVYQNPGSFDFGRWMEDIEDVYWEGTVTTTRRIERVGHPAGFDWGELIARARQRLLRGIDDVYPPWSAQWRYGAVLKAVLWGDRTALDSGTIDDFRKTGLYHLLVIAGLHVGLLTLLVEFLLRALRLQRVTRAIIVLGFLGVYALLVEQRAPTLRATLMIALYLLARILDRGHSPLNAIGGVALVLLYVRPAWLFESGFQLSFAAALLIVGVAVPILERTTEPYRRALLRLDDVLLDDRYSPRIAQARLEIRAGINALRRHAGFFERHPTLARNIIVAPLRLGVWTANMLIFSAVLQLGLLLPMVETFHRVTFAGVGLNALAIPVMTLLLALALPINLLSVLSPIIAAWPARLLTLVMALLFEMTHLPGLASWLSYRMPAPPMWVAWGFGAAFVFAGWALRYAPRMVGAALGVCAALIILVAMHPFRPDLPRGGLEVTALDCGQGDAAFAVLPDGRTMLLDAGGVRPRGARASAFPRRRWDPGEEIVSPYLWSRGIKKIDVLALTRADSDEGLNAVLENFAIGEFWHAPIRETPEYGALMEKLAGRGIPTRTLVAGDVLVFGGAQIQVLWPATHARAAPPRTHRATSEAASKVDGIPDSRGSAEALVMRISAGAASLLISGKLDGDAAKQILASNPMLESQVLKVAYQEGKSAADQCFIARAAPRVAIISSKGASEGGGISAGGDALRNLGARVFGTDVDGATTVQWNGGRLAVRSYCGRDEVVPTEGDKARPKR